MADGYGELRDGAVRVRDGRIAWLGPRAQAPLDGAARRRRRRLLAHARA